jgi:hypothetical protein
MGVTNLPTGCWVMVALIAAFTMWICLSIFGTVLEYERRRRNLGREVMDLRKRYSLSFPVAEKTPDTKSGSFRRVA